MRRQTQKRSLSALSQWL